MSRGEKRLVVLPPDLAYGTGGHYGPNVAGEPRFVIHPNTAIAYELELIDF
jgi:FKBP-type peptidyl-prolyl cis-trans isomerase